MTSAVDERSELDERYGNAPSADGQRRRNRLGVLIAAVLTVAVIVFWGVAQWQQGAASTISTDVINFRIPNDHTIEADIGVTVQPGTPLACALEVTNGQRLVVGWDIIELPASTEATNVVTVEVRTTQPPDGIVVKSCWVA